MTQDLYSRGQAVLSPVLGRYFKQFEVASGKGSYLYDIKGKAFLDFAAGIAVVSTGHCHPKVVNAIKKQAETLIHGMIGITYYEPPIKLGEKLVSILGGRLNSVFFNQSGSEAIETAIKLAKYTSQKQGLLAFQGGFHGRTLGALSITTSKDKYRQGYEPLLEGISIFPYPNCYRCPWGKEKNSCHNFCSGQLRVFLDKSEKDLAAAIIEPILGEGGYVFAPEHFLKTLRAVCTEKDVLLIFDEIQSGIGRTGKWFAFQHYDIEPDIITLAKGIGSGLPLGACVAPKSIMSKWLPGAHGGTYGGNPVTCAAGYATLEVLDDYVDQSATLGAKALGFLNEKLKNHPNVGDIRGLGLMIGIEFVKDKKTKEAFPEKVNDIREKCLKKRLVVISCGVLDNVIRIIPPLTINNKELSQGLDILIETINE
ncbi:aspartate aminotransferase family protein [Candidatus Margulisiibacteriota bacterium]